MVPGNGTLLFEATIPKKLGQIEWRSVIIEIAISCWNVERRWRWCEEVECIGVRDVALLHVSL